MPHLIEKTVYTFTKLDGRTKERATEWCLDGMNDDSAFVIATFENIAALWVSSRHNAASCS
jgi:predicted dehydrogenase